MRPRIYRSSLEALGYGFSHGRGRGIVTGRIATVDLRIVPPALRWTGLRRWTPGVRPDLPSAFAELERSSVDEWRPATLVPGWYATATPAGADTGPGLPTPSRALATLQARLRLSYLSSAEQRSRATSGRGLTTQELQAALSRFPR